MADYLLFDLDGTLTDPAEGITNSVAYALNRYGISVEDKSSLNCFIGPPLVESFERYYGFSHSDAIDAVSVYREYFSDRGIFENKLYLGVSEMLSSLKKCEKSIILATSKPKVFADKILVHFGIDRFFTVVCGSELNGERVDKHDVIEYALKLASVKDRSKAVMIGDRLHDIIGAKKSGIISIGVTYGYGSHRELTDAGADYTVDSVSELTELLRSN